MSVVRTPDIEIPFRYLRQGAPILMLEASVNGQGPFDFILDTGNGLEAIAISPELAGKLGITTVEKFIESRFPVGLSKSLSMGFIEEFEIGGFRTGGRDVGVLAALSELGEKLNARIDGNIGFHFLKDYALTLDFQRSVLTLSVDEPVGPSMPIEVRKEDPLILLDVQANGTPMTFVLDTGASYNCISLPAACTLNLELGKTFAVNGSDADVAYMCKLETLSVAGQTQHSVGLAAVGFLEDLSDAMGIAIDGVLGHTFWSKYRLTIDYLRNRLFLMDVQ